MFWSDRIARGITGPQLINDSKTPSGRVHVGALRGVLIHDAMFRTLKEQGTPVRYQFGVDDYDPLDEIPAGQGDHFRQYLGQPLCNVPAPPGSPATDVAEHFIAEFFDIFTELGVATEHYRMRDIYRGGKFNEVIDVILRNAAVVRKIYKEVRAAGNAFKDTGAFEGFRWSQGVFTTVAGTNELSKIVRDGTAVGLQFASSSGNAEPTVSIGAQAWALQQLLDPQSGAGWDLYWPIDLNEAGTILCQAFDPQGQAQLCVLTPISPIAGAGVSRPARTAQQRAIVERLLREHRSAFAQPARQAD
jgi:hypothetical protein